MSKKKVIAILGPSGSGKDSLLDAVCDLRPELNKVIMYSSRPMRDKEEEGKPYHFIADDEFRHMSVANKMMDTQIFNGWWYGTAKEDYKDDVVNICAYNPAAARYLATIDEIELFPFYVQTSDKARLMRQLCREESPNVDEIIRRFMADKEDFNELPKHFVIDNTQSFSYAVNQLLGEIDKIINK